jgi:hypothetical protein
MKFPYSFNVAGVSFENRCEKIQKYVYRGSKFVLEMEPDNQFDGNAVMVRQVFKRGGKFTVGYVPRKDAAKLTRLLVAGEKFKVSFVVMHIREAVKEKTEAEILKEAESGEGKVAGVCVGLRLKISRDE